MPELGRRLNITYLARLQNEVIAKLQPCHNSHTPTCPYPRPTPPIIAPSKHIHLHSDANLISLKSRREEADEAESGAVAVSSRLAEWPVDRPSRPYTAATLPSRGRHLSGPLSADSRDGDALTKWTVSRLLSSQRLTAAGRLAT